MNIFKDFKTKYGSFLRTLKSFKKSSLVTTFLGISEIWKFIKIFKNLTFFLIVYKILLNFFQSSKSPTYILN